MIYFHAIRNLHHKFNRNIHLLLGKVLFMMKVTRDFCLNRTKREINY